MPPNKNWWPFCSEHLQRQIMYQNDRIFKRYWLTPPPLPIYISNLKKTIKMTWLHMLSGLFFCSSQQPRQIGPTADFEGAAIPPPIFSMERIIRHRDWGDFNDPLAPNLPSAHLWFWVANLPEINIGTIYCHQWFRDTILLTHSAPTATHIPPYLVLTTGLAKSIGTLERNRTIHF